VCELRLNSGGEPRSAPGAEPFLALHSFGPLNRGLGSLYRVLAPFGRERGPLWRRPQEDGLGGGNSLRPDITLEGRFSGEVRIGVGARRPCLCERRDLGVIVPADGLNEEGACLPGDTLRGLSRGAGLRDACRRSAVFACMDVSFSLMVAPSGSHVIKSKA